MSKNTRQTVTGTYYVQVEKDTNRITDIVSYEQEGYEKVTLLLPIPPKIISGCYKLLDGSPVYMEAWDVDMQNIRETLDMVVTSMLES